jgi:hypothetical protein
VRLKHASLLQGVENLVYCGRDRPEFTAMTAKTQL